jgi:hypothetical protein
MTTTATNLPEIEVTTLPSKGLSYPTNFSIKFRPYTFGEVVKINQSKLSLADYYRHILDGITCSFDKNLLSFFDFLFIGIQRRGFSLTDIPLYTKGECLNGHSNLDLEFKLSELDFYDLEVDKLPKSFKYDNKTYSFTLFTIGSYLELSDKNQTNDEIRILSQMCIDPDKEKIYNELSNAVRIDIMSKINGIDLLFSHGVKPLKFECSHDSCNEPIYVDMTEVDSLVLPFRQKQKRSFSNIF